MNSDTVAYVYGFDKNDNKDGCKAVFVRDPKSDKTFYSSSYIGDKCSASELNSINSTNTKSINLICPISSSFKNDNIDIMKCSNHVNDPNSTLGFITYTRSEDKSKNTLYTSSWMVERDTSNDYYQSSGKPLRL